MVTLFYHFIVYIFQSVSICKLKPKIKIKSAFEMSLEFLRWQYLKAVVNVAVSSKVFFFLK